MEYGAMLPASRVVYMKHGSRAAVAAWITEYSTATPLQLVTRNVAGEYPGPWTTAAS